MTLKWTILGIVFQLGMTAFLFMFAAFSAGAAANNMEGFSKMHNLILTLSFWILSLSGLVAAGLLWYFYSRGAAAQYYWLHIIPFASLAMYVVTLSMLEKAGS